MSQQSVTFLSQSASTLFKKPKAPGGCDQFKCGVAGTLALKIQTEEDLQRIAAEEKADKKFAETHRPLRLAEFHYATSVKRGEERKRLGVLDIPPKPVAAIPGYSGWIPRKESANVIGTNYKTGNLQSAELFAKEQEVSRRLIGNILPPSSDLKTPPTYTG